MSKKFAFFIFFAVTFTLFAQQPLYKNSTAKTEERIQDLLKRMNLNEKIGQLCCPLGWEIYTKENQEVRVSELFVEKMKEMPVFYY